MANLSGVGGRWVVRDIPERPWLAMFGPVLVVLLVALACWDAHARARGYGPSINDTPNFWAPHRARAVGAGPQQVVFVGASRTLFDVDLAVFQQEVGGPEPIQLATVGSNPLVVLEDLAADPTYAGTTIVGVVPGLVAAAGGPAVSGPKKYVNHYHQWSVANRMELPIVIFLEERLAFIKSDLSLSELIESSLNLPLRPGVYAPTLPGYMYTLTRNRQGRMADSVASDPTKMAKIQQIWLPLFQGPPKPSGVTQAQRDKALTDGWESNLLRLKKSVASITARGGKVIFSRWPSSGGVYAFEQLRTPRKAFWDRILSTTGAPGIYFEDYPELAGFTCPEWSHLNATDATRYTRSFARILIAKGLVGGALP